MIQTWFLGVSGLNSWEAFHHSLSNRHNHTLRICFQYIWETECKFSQLLHDALFHKFDPNLVPGSFWSEFMRKRERERIQLGFTIQHLFGHRLEAFAVFPYSVTKSIDGKYVKTGKIDKSINRESINIFRLVIRCFVLAYVRGIRDSSTKSVVDWI